MLNRNSKRDVSLQDGGSGGGWVDCLALVDYTVGVDEPTQNEMLPGATFRHAGGRVTSLCIAQAANRTTDMQAVSIISGSFAGSMSAVQVQVPLFADATLEDVQVRLHHLA
jgi:hypothetical protein